MIASISANDWTRLLIALLLALGPGYALLSFFIGKNYISSFFKISTSALAFGFSTSFWAILLLWLKVVQVKITPLTILFFCIAGWGLAVGRVIKAYRVKKDVNLRFEQMLFDVFEFVIVLLYGLVYAWIIRGQVAGLGSDSYHHTLVAEMIVNQGQIPDNFFPYAPIISFSYHYGFHGLIAILGSLSGLSTRLLVLISGPILVVMTGLSAAFFIKTVTKNQIAEMLTLVVISFLAVFPAWMLNWGRYPQILGSVLIFGFLAAFFIWHQKDFHRSKIFLVAFLAIGLSLTHYRMTIICIFGVILYLTVEILMNPSFRNKLRQYIGNWSLAVIVSSLLIAPWVISTIVSHQPGVTVAHSVSLDSDYYAVRRLGAEPLNFPTNTLLISGSLIAILYGLYKLERLVIWILLWWLTLFLVTSPYVIGVYLDRVTFYCAFFIPIGILFGWLASQLLKTQRFQHLMRVVFSSLIAVSLLWGIYLIKDTLNFGNTYVRPDDLIAMEWIEKNTPEDSLFMVNTFAFPFAPEFIISSDAGYWLPLLSGRASVVPPMSYQTERLESADTIRNLVLLHGLGGHLATPDAISLLREQGIDYIYIASKGGIINKEELMGSSDYQLEYQNDANYVFSLVR